MKVVVLGMLEKQVQHANLAEFNHLDVRTENKDGLSGSGCAGVIKNADRILVMTKFISHSAIAALPKSKTTFIKGSVTALRNTLATLNTAAKLQSLSTRPVITQLEAQEEEDMARASPFDFSKLADAETNSIVTYFKPSDMRPETFITAITQARGRLKNKGLISEQTISGGKGKIEVLIKRSIADARREEANREALLAAAKASNRDAEPVQNAVASGPIDTAASPISEAYPNARAIWHQVLTQRLQPGNKIEDALDDAAKAVTAFRGLFG